MTMATTTQIARLNLAVRTAALPCMAGSYMYGNDKHARWLVPRVTQCAVLCCWCHLKPSQPQLTLMGPAACTSLVPGSALSIVDDSVSHPP
jgi:hypothetical protein